MLTCPCASLFLNIFLAHTPRYSCCSFPTPISQTMWNPPSGFVSGMDGDRAGHFNCDYRQVRCRYVYMYARYDVYTCPSKYIFMVNALVTSTATTPGPLGRAASGGAFSQSLYAQSLYAKFSKKPFFHIFLS